MVDVYYLPSLGVSQNVFLTALTFFSFFPNVLWLLGRPAKKLFLRQPKVRRMNKNIKMWGLSQVYSCVKYSIEILHTTEMTVINNPDLQNISKNCLAFTWEAFSKSKLT